MAVNVKEDWEGDALSYGSGGGAEGLRFNIHGAASKFEAWAALRDHSAAVYLGLVRNYIDVTQLGPGVFKGIVKYGEWGLGGGGTALGATPPAEQSPPATADSPLGPGSGDVGGNGLAFSFSFEAETRHYVQSVRTRHRRAPGDALNVVGSAPNYKGAVGVSKSGGNVRVDGYDAPAPTSTFQVTAPCEPMTLAYHNQLRDLVGRMNAAQWWFKEAGTCVLWGVAGQWVSGLRYTLTFTFHERPVVTNKVLVPDPADPGVDGPAEDWDYTLAGALVIPFATGWDQVWVEYDEEVESGQLLARPRYAYVEQVVEYGDFSLLRLG
jgi:hypothetical protein